MDSERQRILGRKVRHYRDAHGLSQEDLAHFLGLHRTYVGGLERGERNLTLKSVERVADPLSADPIELLTPGGKLPA